MQKTELCCNYLHFSLLSLVMSLKKVPVYWASDTIHKDQIFDDENNHKCCVKNLLRFFTNNIARILKEFLLYWIVENLDCFKTVIFI